MNIGGIEIGGTNPCRYIAEVSNNHNGFRINARMLTVAAANAGADFLKMQCYLPDELVALRGDGPAPDPWGKDGWTMRDLYTKAATPAEWFPSLFAEARAVGLVPFSSVFGLESLALLESLNCPAYKIARLDNTKMELIRAVVATGKPVLISHEPGSISDADVRLYCPPGYPQPEMHFTPTLWTHYTGLSYHGTNPCVPMLAVATGAKLIEAHLMLKDFPSELEANVSLDEEQFAQMTGCGV